jgi:hypothetical protein
VGKNKCYIHVFRLEDEIYFRCSAIGKIAKMEDDPTLSCPVCGRDIFIQTDELYPKVRTVYLDRWLNIEEG